MAVGFGRISRIAITKASNQTDAAMGFQRVGNPIDHVRTRIAVLLF